MFWFLVRQEISISDKLELSQIMLTINIIMYKKYERKLFHLIKFNSF